MSTTIDERVVEMEFDNSKFESNVKTSLSTLDKLKKALNFSGAEKGLEEVEKTSGKIDFKEMNSGLEKVQSGFSALEVIAVSALATITAHVTNAGVALAKSLSIDQVTAGWQKYEQKTTGVATLMNNATSALTGQAATIEEVNSALEQLNWYTDETSFNFTDMLGNMGKLTSQNIPLEQSLMIMQGIGNATAVAGQNAMAASRAMYNIAQAYGVGSMKLIDWRSLENANIATAELKQTMMDAAVSVGTLTKAEDGLYKTSEGLEVTVSNFSQTLQHGWATSEVLSTTFENYAKFGVRLQEVTDEVTLTATDMINGMEALAKGKSSDDFIEWSESVSKDLEKVKLTVDDVIPYLEELGGEEYALGRKSFKAAQEARTFSDAIDAIKDGVSTAWMNVFETIFGGYDKAKTLWTNLANKGYDVFAEPINRLNKGLQSIFNFGTSISEKDWLGMDKAVQNSETFKQLLIDTAKEHKINVSEMIAKEGSFTDTLKNRWLTYDILDEAMKKYEDDYKVIAKENGEDTAAVLADLESLKKVAREVLRGDWGNGAERRSLLTEAGYDPALIQRMAEEMHLYGGVTEDCKKKVLEYAESINKMTDEELKNAGISKEAREESDKLLKAIKDDDSALNSLLKDISERSGRDLIIKSFKNIGAAISSVFTPLKESLSGIFPSISVEQIYHAIESFEKFTEKLILTEDQSEKLKTTFSGITSVIGAFIDILVKATGAGFKIVRSLFDAILDIIGESDLLSFTAKIGEALTKFREWVNQTVNFDSIVTKITSKIKKWSKSIKEWIKAFTGSERVSEAVSEIVAWFQKLWVMKPEDVINKIKDSFYKLRKSIREVTTTLKEKGIPAAIDLIKDKLSDLREYLKTKFAPIVDFFSKIWNSIIDTFKQFGIDLEASINKIKNVFDKLKEFLSKFNLGNTLSAAIGVATLIGIIKIIQISLDAFSAITKVVKGAAKVEKAVAKLIKGIRNYINAKALSTASNAVLKLAGAIGIIAASAWVLSQIPTEKLSSITWTLIGIAGALAGLSIVLGLLSGKGIISGDFGATFRDLGIGLALVAASLLMISNIDTVDDPNKLDRAMWVLFATTMTLVTFIGILGKLVPKLSKGSGIFVAMAVAILAIAKAAQMMSSIDADKLQGIASVLIEAFLGMTALSAVLGLLKVGFSQGAAVLAMAVSLLLIVKVIKEIADLSKNLTIDNPGKFAIIAGAILGAVIALMAITKLGGANGLAGGVGVLAMVISMILLVSFIKKLGDTPISDINKAIDILSPIAIFFAALMLFTNLAGPNALKAGASLVLMSFAIGVLALVVAMLSTIEPEDLYPAVVAVGVLGLVFAALLKSSQYAKGATGAIIAMTVAIAAIGIIIGILSFIPWQDMIAPVAGLAILMLALSALFKTVGKIPNPKKALFVILEMIVILGAIAGIIYLLCQNTDSDQALKTALSLTAVILAMSVLALVCSVLGRLGIQSAIVGLKALGIMLAAFVGLGALAYVLSDEIPEDYAERMDKAIGFMQKCGELVGAVIGGVLVGVTDGFGDIGKNLSEFMENAKPFIDGISELDDSFPDKVTSLTKGIRRLATAGLINDLTSIFGDSGISGLTGDLKEFATAISIMATVPIEKIDNVVEAINKISSIDIPTSGGLKGLLTGEKGIGDMGRQLSVFSDHISDFTSIDVSNIDAITTGIGTISSSISDFTTNGVNVEQFLNTITTMQETITQSEATFAELGTSLGVNLGEAFKTELSKISGIAMTQINNAASAVRGRYSNFYSAGAYAGQGIVNGLASMWQECYNMGASLAQAANQGFNDNLKIRSPSRVMYQSAVYAGQGAVNGGLSMVSAVYKAFGEVGNAADEGFSNSISRIADAISSDLDMTPIIRPVLDLSEIQNGANSINGMFGNSTFSINGTVNRARSAYVTNDEMSIEQQNVPSTGTVNNFVQNNYSPKALSRIEIYRQTKNLLNAKG